MRIQHNIAALNSHRQLTNNNSAVAKNLEKLSSGYRINRAGDDAAGLAISEKMRAQITGLDTASKNAQDGISLVQTAEGALTEVHSMLNRMVELADQSANGTYKDEVDRTNIQKEFDSLSKEIDRISSGTNFNGIKLLNGELGGGAAAAAPIVTGTINGADLVSSDVTAKKDVWTSGAMTWTKAGATKITVEYTDAAGDTKTKDVAFTAGADAATSAAAFIAEAKKDTDLAGLFDISGDNTGIIFTAKTTGASKGTVTKLTAETGGTGEVAVANGTHTTTGEDAGKTYAIGTTFKTGDKVKIGEEEYTYDAAADGSDGKKFKDFAALKAAVEKNGTYEVGGTATAATFTAKAGAAGGGLTLQIGENSEAYNQLTVSINDMSTTALKINGLKINTQATAQAAVKKITDAVNQVSETRGDLGAIQNRLEHTINNLGVTSENMSAAESRIRDVDMAKEMMTFTKNNILTQASQAMLAQANQLPQGVLQLLQ